MLKNPCSKTCPKREVGCHAVCQEYIEFRKERNELNARKLAAKNLDNDYHKVRQNHKER